MCGLGLVHEPESDFPRPEWHHLCALTCAPLARDSADTLVPSPGGVSTEHFLQGINPTASADSAYSLWLAARWMSAETTGIASLTKAAFQTDNCSPEERDLFPWKNGHCTPLLSHLAPLPPPNLQGFLKPQLTTPGTTALSGSLGGVVVVVVVEGMRPPKPAFKAHPNKCRFLCFQR